MSKCKLNIELLRQVQAKILDSPDNFYMDYWAKKGSCGTACCIGGWAVALTADKILTPREIRLAVRYEDAVNQRGELWCRATKPYEEKRYIGPEEALGLTDRQGDRLFMVEKWPKRFRVAWSDNFGDAKARAEVAAARIEFFIETNGSDQRRSPKAATSAKVVEQFIETLELEEAK